MAIATIRRVEIITLRENEEGVLKKLQKAGVMHIEKPAIDNWRDDKKITALERQIGSVERSIGFLRRYVEVDNNFVQSFFDPRDFTDDGEIAKIKENFDSSILSEIEELRSEEEKIIEEKKKLQKTLEQLLPYGSLDVDLASLGEGKLFITSVGYVKDSEYEKFRLSIDELSHSEEISRMRGNVYLLVIRPKGGELEGFVEERFEFSGKPGDLVDEITKKLETDELEGIKKRAESLTGKLRELELYCDALLLEKKRLERSRDLIVTKETIIIGGYVREKDLGKLREDLENSTVLDFETDDGPTTLENSAFLNPFETLIKMYGLPHYRSIDPTPFISIPFAIFFGFCLGDVGYGIILMMLSIILPKKIKMGHDGKALFKILFYSSIFTIIVGAFTGSIFGNLLDYLPEQNILREAKNSITLLSPLGTSGDLITLMLISIVIGLLYTALGYGIGCYMQIKNGHLMDGLLDSGIWTMITLTIMGLILTITGLPLPMEPFMYALIAGVAIVVFTHGRKQKGFGKILYGITGLYGLVNVLSDSLSFLRLFALGLSTYILSYVFNVMGSLAAGVPYLGFILFPIILLVGYTFTFLMSGIGSFVHSLRLQYVEFFGKFFEGGEKTFKPFEAETRYYRIWR